MLKKLTCGALTAMLVMLFTLASPALADSRWRRYDRPHRYHHHYYNYRYRPVVRYYAPAVRYYAPAPYYYRPYRPYRPYYQPGVNFSFGLPLPFFGFYIR
jgi:hypothetical protein